MNGDEKFWVSVWGIVGVVVIVVASLIATYWNSHNTKIVELIEKGVDPTEAMCALQNDYGTMPVCIVAATKKGD